MMHLVLLVIGIAFLVIIALVLFTAWTARQVERRLPPRGQFITVAGHRLHYIDEGVGPPLVLVHGLSGQAHNFTYALVGKLRQDFRVIVLDRPGSGYSTRPPGASASLSAQAEVIAQFVKALELDRPLIVGHSLGGAIALALALNHPEQVGGLALIAPVTHPQERVAYPFQGLAIRSPVLRWLIAWTLAVPASIIGRRTGIEAVFGPRSAPDDFAIKGGALLSLRPASFCNASADLVATAADLAVMVPRYPHLTLPIGVLYGTGDRILDYTWHGQALAEKIPSVDLELIEDEGHMVLVTSADRTAEFIARMARRIAPASEPSHIATAR